MAGAVAAGVVLCRFLGNGRNGEIAAAGTIEVREVVVTAKEYGTLAGLFAQEGISFAGPADDDNICGFARGPKRLEPFAAPVFKTLLPA